MWTVPSRIPTNGEMTRLLSESHTPQVGRAAPIRTTGRPVGGVGQKRTMRAKSNQIVRSPWSGEEHLSANLCLAPHSLKFVTTGTLIKTCQLTAGNTLEFFPNPRVTNDFSADKAARGGILDELMISS